MLGGHYSLKGCSLKQQVWTKPYKAIQGGNLSLYLQGQNQDYVIYPKARVDAQLSRSALLSSLLTRPLRVLPGKDSDCHLYSNFLSSLLELWGVLTENQGADLPSTKVLFQTFCIRVISKISLGENKGSLLIKHLHNYI